MLFYAVRSNVNYQSFCWELRSAFVDNVTSVFLYSNLYPNIVQLLQLLFWTQQLMKASWCPWRMTHNLWCLLFVCFPTTIVQYYHIDSRHRSIGATLRLGQLPRMLCFRKNQHQRFPAYVTLLHRSRTLPQNCPKIYQALIQMCMMQIVLKVDGINGGTNRGILNRLCNRMFVLVHPMTQTKCFRWYFRLQMLLEHFTWGTHLQPLYKTCWFGGIGWEVGLLEYSCKYRNMAP